MLVIYVNIEITKVKQSIIKVTNSQLLRLRNKAMASGMPKVSNQQL